MFTDTHAHLDFPQFKEDFSDVLKNADAAGIKRIVSIGTTVEGSRQALALAEAHSNIFAVVGIHPNCAHETEGDYLSQLRTLAAHPKVVALGECGLDYFRLPGAQSGSPEEDIGIKKIQAECFRMQLDLAVELGLNIVVHERAAWEDTLSILRNYTGKLRAVFHCFGKSFLYAEEVISLGHLVSFTGIVTFKNAPDAQEAAARVPSGSYMLETDCPYLAPVPHRGKRAEPAHVRLIAEHIAGLRGGSLATVSAETELAANRFFRFPSS